LNTIEDEIGLKLRPGFAALLYHPRRPCANPRPSAMMNKQQAITARIRQEQDDG
jgi:hypothetical protein